MTISPSVMVRGSYSSVGIFHSTICSVGPVYRSEGGGREEEGRRLSSSSHYNNISATESSSTEVCD